MECEFAVGSFDKYRNPWESFFFATLAFLFFFSGQVLIPRRI